MVGGLAKLASFIDQRSLWIHHTPWDWQSGLPPQTDPPGTTPGRFSAVRPGSPMECMGKRLTGSRGRHFDCLGDIVH